MSNNPLSKTESNQLDKQEKNEIICLYGYIHIYMDTCFYPYMIECIFII